MTITDPVEHLAGGPPAGCAPLPSAPPIGQPRPSEADEPAADPTLPPDHPHRYGRMAGAARFIGGVAAITVAAILVGIELATPDGSGFVQPLDDATAHWVAAHHVAGLLGAGRVAAFIGGPVGAVAIALAATVLLARRTRSAAVSAAPLLALATVQAAVQTTKAVVGRPRPSDFAAVLAHGHAFPSGHAATAAALATSLVLIARRTPAVRARGASLTAAAVAATVAIAASRLVLGVHWLSDVIAGIVVGVALGGLATGVLLPPARRPRVLAPVTRRRLRNTAAGIVAAALLLTGVSYAGALTAAGSAPADARTVDWLRNHGLSPAVDRAESWWLWRHAPSPYATLSSMPTTPLAATGGSRAAAALPAAIIPTLTPPLPGEGAWTPVLAAGGVPQLAVASMRADPQHPSVVATLAWLNQSAVRFELIAGTKQPFGSPGAQGAQVPVALQSQVLAAFNSGYKMKDTPGGAVIDGQRSGTLEAGLATLAVRRDGSIAVGQWGRDLTAADDLVAVRQNLHLIVDGGQLVDGLAHNVGGRWGSVKNALPTWRSGVGIDAAGNLIYASGNHLTLDTLGAALLRAGATTAMELDIHTHMVTFNFFTHPAGSTRPTGHKLSLDMTESASRYLRADQRDFVAVYPR